MTNGTIKKLGVVGLGDQGTPMAERWIAAGWPLTFYARRPEVAARFEGLGATRAPTLRDLGAASDMLAVVVIDDAQVRDVVLGASDDGVLSGMAPGSVIVIHSTAHPDTCRELDRIAAARGVTVVDAPVSGGPARSKAGTLTLMVGTDPETFARIEPALKVCGSLVKRMGDVGAGQITKLINNFFVAVQVATSADEVRLIRAFGLDLEAAAEVLPTCTASSNWFAMEASRKFVPAVHDKGATFGLQVLGKDNRLLRELMAAQGMTLFSDELVRRSMDVLMAAAEAQDKDARPRVANPGFGPKGSGDSP